MTISVSQKSRLASLLLAFLFGGFGVHRFYVGRSATAVLQLLMTLSIVGLIVSFIWVWVDIIMIIAGSFRDKNGDVVRNWTD